MIKNQNLVSSLVKVMAIGCLFLILLWILQKVFFVVLVFLFAMVLALIINTPVSWLEKKGLKRWLACLVVFGIIFLVFAGLTWLIVPRVYRELTDLVANLPRYVNNISVMAMGWFEDYPEITAQIQESGSNFIDWLPPTPQLIRQVSNYSITFFGMLFLIILFACIVVYTVSRPRPLLKLYFSFFPNERLEKAQNALIRTGSMLTGWIKANLIGGSIEAVATTIFLSAMNVPGAWVWGAITLFAELIPNIGFYLMAIPPVLVALSVDPMTALWVLIFFIVMSEIMADLVMPRLLHKNMNLHPVSTLVMLLVMASAFGLVGALLTVPVTAIIKAYYIEFYASRVQKSSEIATRVERVIYGQNDERKIEALKKKDPLHNEE